MASDRRMDWLQTVYASDGLLNRPLQTPMLRRTTTTAKNEPGDHAYTQGNGVLLASSCSREHASAHRSVDPSPRRARLCASNKRPDAVDDGRSFCPVLGKLPNEASAPNLADRERGRPTPLAAYAAPRHHPEGRTSSRENLDGAKCRPRAICRGLAHAGATFSFS